VRIRGGAGRRLANDAARESNPGMRPCSSDRVPCVDIDSDPWDDGPEDRIRERVPVERDGFSYSPDNLMRVPGVETRAPAHELVYLMRAFGAWTPDTFTGTHGVIGPRPADAGQAAGSMQPWDAPRRTLRSQPLVPWDAGTAVGPGTLDLGGGA
jgi:hypothetical protein